MNPSTKRGYIWSAIIFMFSPIWGLIQAALTFGTDKVATQLEEDATLAPRYRVLEGALAGRIIAVKKHQGDRVFLTDADLPGDVLICTRKDVIDAVKAGRVEPIYGTQ